MAPLFPSSSLSSLNPGSLTAASLGGLAPHNATVPALYLYPLNYLSPSTGAQGAGGSASDTWAPKHIALTSVHTKIGRQTSSKTAPGERNGYFDSKVLSRQHAEVWEESGKIFIKDVKSSNGTFINGERLSSEGHESEPFELKSDDIVEFGIDIVGEDNKTIIHHKVAARVVCVFTDQDAAVAARAEQHALALHSQHHPGAQSNAHLLSQGPTGSGFMAGGGVGGQGGIGREGSMNMSMHQQHLAHLAQQAAASQGHPSHPSHPSHPGQPQQIQPGLNTLNGAGHLGMNGAGGGMGGGAGGVGGGIGAGQAAAAAAARRASMGGLGGLGGLGGMGGPSSASGTSTSPNGTSNAQGTVNGLGASSLQHANSNQQHQQGGAGGVGGQRPGKSGLSFDVILSRLQGEVQKSRETGLELAGVGGTLGEVGGVLVGGGEGNHLPNYPAHLPPVRPPPVGDVPAIPGAAAASKEKPLVPTAPSSADGDSKKDLVDSSTAADTSATASSGIPSEKTTTTLEKTATEPVITDTSAAPNHALIATLQSQLSETQSALAAHLDRVRALEGVLAEQAALRREVGMLRAVVESGSSSKVKELDGERDHEPALQEVSLEERPHEDGDETEVEGEDRFRPRYGGDEDEEDDEDDDDDAHSIATTMPASHGHELESVAEEDEDVVEEVHVDKSVEHEGGDEHEVHVAGDDEEAVRDGDDAWLSEQEKREIELGRQEDEAEAEAESVAREHGLKLDDHPEQDIADDHDDDFERRRDRADGVSAGRPHTPEPTRAVTGSPSIGGPGVRRRSLASPLSQVSNHSLMRGDVDANVNTSVHEQLQKLAAQLGTVLALTTSLEAQHAAAQGTIVALEGKVASLEGMLKEAEDALRGKPISISAPSATKDQHHPMTLTTLLAAWKSSVEGQWGVVQEEWHAERKRLAEAREEWESRREEWDAKKGKENGATAAVDAGQGSKTDAGDATSTNVQNLLAEHQTAIRDLQQQYRAQQAQLNATTSSSSHGHTYSHGNGDALKHTGGLVTPPSPRSQSSDSNRRYRRGRRRSSSASRSSRSPSPDRHHHRHDHRDSHHQHDDERPRHLVDEPHTYGATEGVSSTAQKALHAPERSLASPEPSVYSSVGSLDGKTLVASNANSSPTKRRTDLVEREGSDELDPTSLYGSGGDASAQGGKGAKPPLVPVNVQAAMGVMLLSVAAAAVMWKVQPE